MITIAMTLNQIPASIYIDASCLVKRVATVVVSPSAAVRRNRNKTFHLLNEDEIQLRRPWETFKFLAPPLVLA